MNEKQKIIWESRATCRGCGWTVRTYDGTTENYVCPSCKAKGVK